MPSRPTFKLLTLASLAVLLAGCDTSSTRAVPRESGMLAATSIGRSWHEAVETMHEDAYRQAANYCAGSSKTVKAISIKDSPATPFPSAELIFRCES